MPAVRALAAALLAMLAVLSAALLAREASGASPGKNIVLILTDDMTTSELAAMPNVQALIAAHGTSSTMPTRRFRSAARPGRRS